MFELQMPGNVEKNNGVVGEIGQLRLGKARDLLAVLVNQSCAAIEAPFVDYGVEVSEIFGFFKRRACSVSIDAGIPVDLFDEIHLESEFLQPENPVQPSPNRATLVQLVRNDS